MVSKQATTMTPTEELVIYIVNHFPNENLTQMVLHKLLYFIDKSTVQELGKRITYGSYKANRWGPTHNHLKVIEPDLAAWVNVLHKGSKTYYQGLKNREVYSFTEEELSIINNVIEKYRNASLDTIIKDSHDEYWQELKNKEKGYQYAKYDTPIVSEHTLAKIRETVLNAST